VLQDNGGDNLTVSANGPFTFATALAGGAGYAVTVKTNPAGQTCTVANGSGTIGSANVTSVAVSCAATATYTVGGSVSGSSGTVVLQDNGGDNLTVSANGPFTFATALAGGAGYAVTVMTSPAGQTCTVANGSGTVGSANVTNVAVSCAANPGMIGSDDFNRADGSLGANWTNISDGGLAITSQAVAGTASAGVSGDIRTAAGESYPGDQYSSVQVTSTQLTGGQWIGPMVRAQNGGLNAYVGIYFWNNGSPEMQLFKRSGSNTWTQLGGTYNSGALAAGTQLQVTAVGSTISFLQNGVTRISAADTSLTGGAPGIMSYGTGQVDNWQGGTATAGGGGGVTFQVQYVSTDANGVASYQVTSANNGPGPQVMRVLAPTNPAPGVPHNFIFVLPVEAGLANDFGDGLDTLRGLNAQNQYNLTIIEPTFTIDPWYADNAIDPNVQYETFMTKELVPWVDQHLATTGTEQNWLIGFSKSGIGGQDLILKHPDIFSVAASWDFPADMSSYDQFGSDSAAGYGTDANFQANYRLTTAFVDAHKGPFLSNNRIWIGSYQLYGVDVSDYNTLLTSEGILHTTEPPQSMAHSWDSGWVPMALTALYQDSISLSSPGSATSNLPGVGSRL
jgi:Putative esterase